VASSRSSGNGQPMPASRARRRDVANAEEATLFGRAAGASTPSDDLVLAGGTANYWRFSSGLAGIDQKQGVDRTARSKRVAPRHLPTELRSRLSTFRVANLTGCPHRVRDEST
jgi:hypothetical protein